MASRSNKQVRYATSNVQSSAPKTPPAGMAMANTLKPLSRFIPRKKPSPMANAIQQVAGARRANRVDGQGRIVEDPTDRSGNRLGNRRQVGEANPELRRALLQQKLKETEKRSSAPKTPPPRTELSSPGGGSGNERRRRVIDQTVDRMSR